MGNEKIKEEAERKMNKHIKIIALQVIFLVAVAGVLYLVYPKANIEIKGTLVIFNSVNANVIIISENPDFSNPRYLDFESRKNITFDLKPGTYYWKASNNLIEGLSKEFKIESEVGMKIDVIEGDEAKLSTVGNVKLNVTRNKEGMMVGYIILEPNDSEEIENSGEYAGRQN